jgi:hypothetical protein
VANRISSGATRSYSTASSASSAATDVVIAQMTNDGRAWVTRSAEFRVHSGVPQHAA